MTSASWSLSIPPAGPSTLAAIRFVIAAQALWMLLSRDPAAVSTLPAVIWQDVDWAFRVRFFLAPGLPRLETILWFCAVASTALVLLGLGTRVFGVAAAILIYHLAALQDLIATYGLWGKGFTIAVVSLPILACSPCEDRWALAQCFGAAPRRDPQAYGWPVMLVRLLFAEIYLFSALGKLYTAGIGWASVESVRTQILVMGLSEPKLDPLNWPLNAWIVAHPAICAVLAAGTLFFEVVFITAVFIRSVRQPLALGGVFFHMGLWATLGFRYLNLPHFLIFLDLDKEQRHSDSLGAAQRDA